MKKSGRIICSVVTAFVFFAAPLVAEPAAAKGGAAKERVDFIEKSLQEGQKNARIWWGLWIAGYAGLAGGQYALGAIAWNHNENWSRLDRIKDDFNMDNKTTFPKKEQWVNYFVGATKSALSLGMLLVMPFTPAYAAGALAEMPEGTADELSRKLTAAERMLEK